MPNTNYKEMWIMDRLKLKETFTTGLWTICAL